jgi:YVTN family beta-propeller protein
MQLMSGERGAARLTAVVLMLGLTVAGIVLKQEIAIAQSAANRFAGPTSSQPLGLDASGSILVVANPDNNTATLFDVQGDRHVRVQESWTGLEPAGVAVMPDGTRAYVANTVSGSIAVMAITRGSRLSMRYQSEIPVGTEPYGLALTPNGRKLYVTNSRSHTVSVIDTATNRVVKTITNVGLEPRGLAITNDNDAEDDDETIYVTQFLAVPINGKLDGEDDSKSGLVTVLDGKTDTIVTTAELKPLRDTGFNAAGDAIRRIAPPAVVTEESLTNPTGAYPNQLNNIAIKGDFAYIPNTGASPNGPVRFDVNTQALVAGMDRRTNRDADVTQNLHLAVRQQTATPRLFMTQPWAMAFKNRTNEGFVLSAASDVAAKISIDPQTGRITILRNPNEQTRVLQIPTGKNPRGIVINGSDSRAYIMNFVSRDVTVLDLTKSPEPVLATLRSSALPAPGSFEETIHVGKELYYTSVGTFDPASPFEPPVRGRMSNNGWGSCGACHPNGLSDNVVWIFPAGPRRTIPQHADFDPSDVNQMRMLNWSSNRDEQEDFELNIRGVSGGQGLIVRPDTLQQEPNVADLAGVASGGRVQLTVRNVPAWDALKAYIQFGVRSPLSPLRKDDPDVIAGEQVFRDANCQSCHGTAMWSTSRVRHTPPPAADLIAAGQIRGELRKAGTFDPTLRNEVRQNAAAPLGADGFVPPSIMSIHAFPQTFFHNGSVDSLEKAMDNVEHRSSGKNGVDPLGDPERRRQLIKFLLSIDGNTPPIQP